MLALRRAARRCSASCSHMCRTATISSASSSAPASMSSRAHPRSNRVARYSGVAPSLFLALLFAPASRSTPDTPKPLNTAATCSGVLSSRSLASLSARISSSSAASSEHSCTWQRHAVSLVSVKPEAALWSDGLPQSWNTQPAGHDLPPIIESDAVSGQGRNVD
eukprot:3460296-Rhodomonas_salina.5